MLSLYASYLGALFLLIPKRFQIPSSPLPKVVLYMLLPPTRMSEYVLIFFAEAMMESWRHRGLFKNIHWLIWLPQVLVVCGIFQLQTLWGFHHDMWALSWGMGSSPLIRDGTWARCLGSAESANIWPPGKSLKDVPPPSLWVTLRCSTLPCFRLSLLRYPEHFVIYFCSLRPFLPM